jgi:hypothetical protein
MNKGSTKQIVAVVSVTTWAMSAAESIGGMMEKRAEVARKRQAQEYEMRRQIERRAKAEIGKATTAEHEIERWSRIQDEEWRTAKQLRRAEGAHSHEQQALEARKIRNWYERAVSSGILDRQQIISVKQAATNWLRARTAKQGPTRTHDRLGKLVGEGRYTWQHRATE